MQTLRDHQLYAKLSKCEFWLQEIGFLGYIVCKEGIRIDSKKIEAVSGWPRPTNMIEIQGFPGFSRLL